MLDHLILYHRMRSELASGKLSERQAQRRVCAKYYPDRKPGGVWQTWLELSKVRLAPGARPECDGYIHAGWWEAGKKKSGARLRMLTVANLLMMVWQGVHRPPGMDELTYQELRRILGRD